MTAPTKVLYIAGSGRSGSTLLANIVGSVPGFVSGGELRYIWDRGILQDRLCGCGERFSECPVWQSVLKEAAADGTIDAAVMAQRQWLLCQARRVPTILRHRHQPVGRQEGDGGIHADTLGRLYRALCDVTASRVVVDSSKLPTYGHLLETVASIDLHVVHLVRDPRAAAHSWMRTKSQPDHGVPGHMQKQGAIKSSLLWDLWNVTAESLWGDVPGRYLRLRYEDFVRAPDQAVARILAMLGEQSAISPLHHGNEVALATNHSVAGNPDRLRSGVVEVRPDSEWLRSLGRRDWALVTSLTAPVLVHHRYSLGRRRSRSVAGVG